MAFSRSLVLTAFALLPARVDLLNYAAGNDWVSVGRLLVLAASVRGRLLIFFPAWSRDVFGLHDVTDVLRVLFILREHLLCFDRLLLNHLLPLAHLFLLLGDPDFDFFPFPIVCSG